MNYIELCFTLSPREPAVEILIAELSEMGFESFVETDDGVNAYIVQEAFLENFHEHINVLNNTGIKASYNKKIIEKQNWNHIWETSFSPVIISDKCCIRASFHKPQSLLYEIIIDPKMSFGTGHHETTTLMIEEILEMDLENLQVADIGCGTGVLAILASKMGATEVEACDIDEWSVKNAFENICINRVNNISLKKGKLSELQKKVFNVILANINRNVLIADLKKYSELLDTKGSLIISGFFYQDVEMLTTEADNNGLALFGKKSKGNWALLHFIKE